MSVQMQAVKLVRPWNSVLSCDISGFFLTLQLRIPLFWFVTLGDWVIR